MRFIALSILLLCSFASVGTNPAKTKYNVDGIYEGESRSIYCDENYWGVAKVTIKDGKIADVTFTIIDKNTGEIFDKKYERHFAGNDKYIEQCRNDLKGAEAYTKKFKKEKQLSKVDAISGATWAHNLFAEAVKIALEKAEKAKKK